MARLAAVVREETARLRAENAEQAAELERVRADLAVLQRMGFGRSSERAGPEPSADGGDAGEGRDLRGSGAGGEARGPGWGAGGRGWPDPARGGGGRGVGGGVGGCARTGGGRDRGGVALVVGRGRGRDDLGGLRAARRGGRGQVVGVGFPRR